MTAARYLLSDLELRTKIGEITLNIKFFMALGAVLLMAKGGV